MSNWLHHGKPVLSIDDLPAPDKAVGFVYRITNLRTGQIYIGKKALASRRKKPLAKKDLPTDKRKKTYTVVVKESDWKTYWGSNKDLQLDVVTFGEEFFRREILEVCYTKKYLTFAELFYQFNPDATSNTSVLARETYNGNILGRFYRKDMQNTP